MEDALITTLYDRSRYVGRLFSIQLLVVFGVLLLTACASPHPVTSESKTQSQSVANQPTAPSPNPPTDVFGRFVDADGIIRGSGGAGSVEIVRKKDESTLEAEIFAISQIRIDAYNKGDIDKVYDLLSDASRLAIPKLVYANRMISGGRKYLKPLRVNCESAVRCDVKMLVSAQVQLRGIKSGLSHETVLDEVWILGDRGWRYVDVAVRTSAAPMSSSEAGRIRAQ